MARAYRQTQPYDDETEPGGDWQSLRAELVALLEQVDSRVGRTQPEPAEQRYEAHRHEPEPQMRQRDALKSVQRAIDRFEPPATLPPNPRDSLEAAISQIRARQGEQRAAAAAPAQPAPPATTPVQHTIDAPMLERLAQSVNGLSGRLERLEGEIKAQVKAGANVKDVADQVSQLAHVVELLAGAVGETGQVKRLEGQIASLGKIMAQGRETDIANLTRRLDDVAGTIGQLADLQVHFADRVQNPVETQAFQEGMASIEQSVRHVYDRIDALEKRKALSPEDLDHLTGEMARFTEAMRDASAPPHNLVELVDALNTRISDIESGDKLIHGLRKDLTALRDAVVVSLAPRFDAIETRIDTLSDTMSTREDVAELGRQIGTLGDRIGERPIDPGIGQLEAQVRQLVARMDQTGEQLSGLAKLYSNEPAMPDMDAVADLVATRTYEAMRRDPPSAPVIADVDAMADMVAMRTFEAMQRHNPHDDSLAETISGLETRITTMLESMRRDPEVDDFSDMQAGIAEVNDRLKRLEASLTARANDDEASPLPAVTKTPQARVEAVSETPATPPVQAPAEAAPMVAEAKPAPMRRGPEDAMPASPAEDAPLTAQPFPAPAGPVETELAKTSRRQHPGLADELSLTARHDDPKAPAAVPSAAAVPALPPAPTPSPGFEPEPTRAVTPTTVASPTAVAESPSVTASSRNTFIEAARRAAQRQTQTPKAELHSNSLIGRALARFQTGDKDAVATPRLPSGGKPTRTEFKPEPVIAPMPVATPAADKVEAADKPALSDKTTTKRAKKEKAPKAQSEPKTKPESKAATEPAGTADGAAQESFLLRNRKVILLAAAVVALAFLTANLVVQRMHAEPQTPAADPAPITTGDNGSAMNDGTDIDGLAASGDVSPAAAEPSMPPRVIPMVDSLATGSIDSSAAQGFTTTPSQAMPSAFSAASDLASSMDTANIAPLAPEASPVKVELPPEGVGPIELRQAAANGDPRAQFEVGAIYSEGRAMQQDYAAAATWYERAAAQGFAPAQYRLGSLYESGNGVDKDLDTARLWYERAAEAGNRMSMHNLAALYAGGQLGKQQFDSAAKWFEEAAKRGLTDSQFNLGMLYARGLGVPQDLQQSYLWFGIAALSGDKDSAKARDDMARSLDADTVTKLQAQVAAFKPEPVDIPANFAPIGTWSTTFDPGEQIGAKDIVATVQKALDKLGYDAGTPDGVAGPKTADAIKSFEHDTGMSQVGQINPRLLAVLGSQPV